jgi:hypothetical protein
MNNYIDENNLNEIFDKFQNERNNLMTSLKNDKELNHSKSILLKLAIVERITKDVLKLRNQIIKDKHDLNNL